MIETRSLEVSVGTKDYYLNVLPCFGWVVSKIQKVDTEKVSGQPSILIGTSGITSSIEYYVITVTRDTKMENYGELSKLFSEFESVEQKIASLYPHYNNRRLIIPFVFCVLFSIVRILLFINSKDPKFLLVFCMFLMFLPIIVVRIIRVMKRRKVLPYLQKRGNQLKEKARSLVV